ncbi:esterase [Nocardioides sp. Root1257]|uniref:alpha/beta hydrolase n=1 Tax=unclassified Nocardioides TaxID=2615069 RepID=UPI00070161F7|nr:MULTISPECIES: alpha/beta fold hydrolase [unclassified Nocardioides]KQW53369.1 esterase [Nocardioides sp. Root1257]KRC56055.1 esterase [Nocardioides sp. Root224]
MTTIHPLATPYSVPAQPDLTGGRRIGVLLSHGFTGQPASMTPWAESLAAKGYAVELPRLPGHGTTWQEMNTTTWADWYGEISRAFEKLAAENDAVVVGGLSMGGALVLRLAEDNPDRVAGVMVVNPAIATKRLDVKLLPILKHLVPSFPGIANDIKKEGVEEHGYTKTPLKAAHSMMQAWPTVAADLPKITAPMIYFRSTEDHVVDEKTQPIITSRISSRDVTVVPLENSYHVATLDNDAVQIFTGSAEFIARVTTA